MKRIITCVLIAFAIALVIPSMATAQNDDAKKTANTAENVTTPKQEQVTANAEEGQSNAEAGNVAETVDEGTEQAVVATEEQTEETAEDQAEETAEEETDEKADTQNSGSGWLKYLLAMLAISGLCSGAVFFILNKRIDELNRIIRSENQASQRMINQRLDNLVVKTDRIETSVGSVRQDIRNRAAASTAPVTGYPMAQNTPSAQPAQVNRPTQFYLGMPGADGSWSDVSATNKPGQCLYVINSQDGMSGTFKVINEPVAVQSILMAVGKYLSPVCRVTNTATQVSGIVTDEPGVAVNDNGVWRMTKKAVVHYV